MRALAAVRRVTPILYLNTVMEGGNRNWFSFVVGLEEGDSRAGGFALVIGVARHGNAGELLAGGADMVVEDLGELVSTEP